MFVREYSALPGLQRAGAVRYALAQQGTQLCLTAQRFDAAGRAEGGAACCPLTGVERPAAERLLRYLYENSVEPAAMRDVVADCLGRGAAAGRQPVTRPPPGTMRAATQE